MCEHRHLDEAIPISVVVPGDNQNRSVRRRHQSRGDVQVGCCRGDLLQDAWIDRIDVDLGTADRFLAEFCSWLSPAKRADAEPLAAGQAVQNLGLRGLQLRWHALALARIGYETASWKIDRSKTGPTTAIGTSPQSAERGAKPL